MSVPPSAPRASAGTPDSRHATHSLTRRVCQARQQNVHPSLRAAGERRHTRFPSRVIALIGVPAPAAGSTHPTHSLTRRVCQARQQNVCRSLRPRASAGTPDSRHASSRRLVCQRPQRARHTLLTRSHVGCVKLTNKMSVPPSAPRASAGTPDSRHASSRRLVCQRPQRARHTLLTQ